MFLSRSSSPIGQGQDHATSTTAPTNSTNLGRPNRPSRPHQPRPPRQWIRSPRRSPMPPPAHLPARHYARSRPAPTEASDDEGPNRSNAHGAEQCRNDVLSSLSFPQVWTRRATDNGPEHDDIRCSGKPGQNKDRSAGGQETEIPQKRFY